jgi:hypothetical protein
MMVYWPKLVAYKINNIILSCLTENKYSRISFCDDFFYDDSFYVTYRVEPSTHDLWCIIVPTKASFLYLGSFQIFSDVHVFLILFSFISCKLIVIFHPLHPSKKQIFLFCKKAWKEKGRLTLEAKMLVIRKMEAGKKRKLKLYVMMKTNTVNYNIIWLICMAHESGRFYPFYRPRMPLEV